MMRPTDPAAVMMPMYVPCGLLPTSLEKVDTVIVDDIGALMDQIKPQPMIIRAYDSVPVETYTGKQRWWTWP